MRHQDAVARGKTAAALKYEPGKDDVPIISALGEGYVAERIIEKAVESNVPVVEDKSLAEMLAKFSAGDAIPPRLYEAVAQVLVFISRLDAQAQERRLK